MKKKWLLAAFSLAAAACCAIGLAACGPKNSGGDDHHYAEWWSFDRTAHWHDCLDRDGAMSDRGPHIDEDSNGECDLCGFPMGGGSGLVESIETFESEILASTDDEMENFFNFVVNGNFSDYSQLDFEWTIEDESVATVEPAPEYGGAAFRPIGHRKGVTQATVTVGGKSATMTIYVIEGAIDDLDIHAPTYTRIEKGQSAKIAFTGADAEWLPIRAELSGGDTDADSFRVNDDGTITALDEGECPYGITICHRYYTLDKESPYLYCNSGSRGLHYWVEDFDEPYAYLFAVDAGCEKDVVIADTYRGVPVTMLRSHDCGIRPETINFSDAGITSVKLSANTQIIGNSEFRDCTDLKSVDFNGATFGEESDFGEEAFRRSGITDMDIPNGLESIGSFAFGECEQLVSVTLPESITVLGYSAFSDCTQLSEITLPSGLTEIPAGLFDGCAQLSRVNLPERLTAIDVSAFADCVSLTSISLPATVTKLAGDAFRGAGLTEFVFPEGLTEVGEGVVTRSQVTSITFPTDLSVFEECCPSYRKMQDFLFGDDGCPELETVIFKEGTAAISYRFLNAVAQELNGGVGQVSIPDSFEGLTGEDYYDEEAYDKFNYHKFNYQQMPALEEGNARYLGNESNPYVFLINSEIQDEESVVTIHEGTKIIGKNAVKANGEVTVPDGVVAIDENAFVVNENEALEWGEFNYTLTSLSLPASLASLGIPFTNGTRLAEIEVRGDSGAYVSEGNVLYDAARTTVCYVAPCMQGALSFAEGVTDIGEGAMDGSFASVTTLHIPRSLTSLPALFEGEKFAALTAITVAEENNAYAAKTGVLYDADLTQILCVPANLSGDVVIAESITDIGTLFAGRSGITSLVIPDGVEVFEKGAIAGLDSLQKLTLPWLGGGKEVVNRPATNTEEEVAKVNYYFGYIFGQNYGRNMNEYGPDAHFQGVSETLKEVVVTKQINVIAHTFYLESSNIETIRFTSTEHWDDKKSDGTQRVDGYILDSAFPYGLKNLYLARGIGEVGVLPSTLEVLVLPYMNGVTDPYKIKGTAKTVYYAETTHSKYNDGYINTVADRLAKLNNTEVIYTGAQWHWEDGQGHRIGTGDDADDRSVWALGFPVPNDPNVYYYKAAE